MSNLHGITTKKVMDVGAGVGYLAGELVEEGYSVVAIEGDEKSSQKCRESMSQTQCITKHVNNESDLHVLSDPCISVGLRMSSLYYVNLVPDGCGDLSVNNVRHFVFYDNVKLLLDVPCCYNRLSSGYISTTCCLTE